MKIPYTVDYPHRIDKFQQMEAMLTMLLLHRDLKGMLE